MPVDAVFCDQSGREFNEFVPVDLLLGPYMNDLQSSAAAVDAVIASEGDERASSGQSVTEPYNVPAGEHLEAGQTILSYSKILASIDELTDMWYASGPAKLPRWKTRTAEQYVAHRRNQHKYREREKQRVKELSSTLQDLSARVHKHAIQDAETELLEEESEELQKLSCQLDIQLATLRQKAHANAEFSRPVSPLSPLVTRSSGDTTQGSLQSSTIPCSMTDPMQQHHTMYEAYEFLVNEIKRFLQTLGYWPIVITGSVPDVTKEAEDKIHVLMKDLMTVCMEMCRLSNSMRQDVRSYMAATAEELDKPGLCLRPVTFDDMLRQLQLSKEQQQEMLAVRKTWRDFLAGVYSERQELNQQILGQLTDTAAMNTVECLMQKQEYVTPHSRANIVHAEKHQQPAQSPIACPAPIKTEEHIIATDMDSAHDQLPVLLAQLEQNLARELRHISEQDYVTLTKLLKPVQAAWFIVLAYPEHCDCLALLNAIQRKEEG